jgi:HSP20 family protein
MITASAVKMKINCQAQRADGCQDFIPPEINAVLPDLVSSLWEKQGLVDIVSSFKKEATMSIIKRNDLFPAMHSMFDDLFSRDLWNWGLTNNSTTNTTIPAVNIRETKDNFEVEMAAPGMTKNDFRVELEGNLLTIRSEKQEEREQNDEHHYSRREFSYQSFQRSFQLHKDVVDADKIGARYENGVLHLMIPKKEEAKQRPPRMIEIH